MPSAIIACLQELIRAVLQRKPLIVVLEEDEGRGGLSESEVRACFDDEKWDALLSTVKNRLGATRLVDLVRSGTGSSRSGPASGASLI